MTAEAALARAVLDSTGHPWAALGRGGLELNRGGLELNRGGLELDRGGLELNRGGLELDSTGQYWAALSRYSFLVSAELNRGGLEQESVRLEDAKFLPRLCMTAPVYLVCEQVCKGR